MIMVNKEYIEYKINKEKQIESTLALLNLYIINQKVLDAFSFAIVPSLE